MFNRPFIAADWYWRVGGADIYHSGRQAVVPADDAAFLAWIAAGNVVATVPGFDDLRGVLETHGRKLYAADKTVRAWTPNEFRARLTTAERAALDAAIAAALAPDADEAVRGWAIQFMAADSLSLDDPRYGEGLSLLVILGVIAAPRRDQLLQPE